MGWRFWSWFLTFRGNSVVSKKNMKSVCFLPVSTKLLLLLLWGLKLMEFSMWLLLKWTGLASSLRSLALPDMVTLLTVLDLNMHTQSQTAAGRCTGIHLLYLLYLATQKYQLMHLWTLSVKVLSWMFANKARMVVDYYKFDWKCRNTDANRHISLSVGLHTNNAKHSALVMPGD